MECVIDELMKVGQSIEKEDRSTRNMLDSITKSKNEINALIWNHCRSAKEVAELCGMSHVTFREFYQSVVTAGLFPEVEKTGGQYRFTLEHVHLLMELAGSRSWQDDYPVTQILCIESLKGGTGKTTTAISVASTLALSLLTRPRVLLIDLDPQGSLSVFSAIETDSDQSILTTVDLMLGEKEEGLYHELLANGYAHEAILKAAVIRTHIPNLDILPAFPDDERFNSLAWEDMVSTGSMDHFLSLLKDRIIAPLKSQYDIIIIDTAPQINPLVWSALEACNGLLIPCTPKTLDWASTGRFINQLPMMLKRLPNKGANIRWWRAIAVNYDIEHNRDAAVLNRMSAALGKHLMLSKIKRSQAFETAQANQRTVSDIRKSDALCPPRQLDRAEESLRDLHDELLHIIRQHAGIPL